jgi:predicted flap endonuclease-1-like 5' DNA nuclease
MRRLAGAWLLFLLILISKPGPPVRRLIDNRSPQPVKTTVAPVESRGDCPELPARFRSDPLLFFSTAPRDSLILLPGIGPVLAARIVDARGGKRLFKTWDDLLRVKGIGPKTIDTFKRSADVD